MSKPEFVRVLVGDRQTNVARLWAEQTGMHILHGEPVTTPSGNPRPDTRANGRPIKPKTTVQAEAAKKSATATGANKADAMKENPS